MCRLITSALRLTADIFKKETKDRIGSKMPIAVTLRSAGSSFFQHLTTGAFSSFLSFPTLSLLRHAPGTEGREDSQQLGRLHRLGDMHLETAG